MAGKYQSINDLYFTEGGDFFVGANGDLEDTKKHQYRGFIQKVLTKIKSTKGEWRLQPQLGANISFILGKKNTKEQADRLKSFILKELIKDSFISAKEINISVFPGSKETLIGIIEINPADTQKKFMLSFTYDFRDNRIHSRII